MASSSENTHQQIQETAARRLQSASSGAAFLTREQGGVETSEFRSLLPAAESQTKAATLLGLTELTAQLRAALFEKSAQSELKDFSKKNPEPRTIEHQLEFVRELLGNQPQLLTQLAEISAKASLFTETAKLVPQNEKVSLLSNQIAAWNQTIGDIAARLTPGESERAQFQTLVHQQSEALRAPRKKQQTSFNEDASNNSTNATESYAQRLQKLLQKPRAVTLLSRKVEPAQAAQLSDELLNQYFDTAFTINAVRVLDRIQRPHEVPGQEPQRVEAIDLVALKAQIGDVFKQAESLRSIQPNSPELQEKLRALDQQIEQALIPIANKVRRIFPHQSSTNLSDVLENEEAICAGKVNVLLTVSKYLGLNARANTVDEMLDNGTSGHVCFECDLPSGKKLVVDGNFANSASLKELAGKTEDELAARIRSKTPDISLEDLEKTLKYAKRVIANAQSIPPQSQVLIYQLEQTGQIAANSAQLDRIHNQPFLTIRLNPSTGAREVWHADIPHPHRFTSPDKDGHLTLNSSILNNSTAFLSKSSSELGPYLYQKYIEISPYTSRPYIELAQLLPFKEGAAFLERIKAQKPAFYWEQLSAEHAALYAKNGELPAASKIFEAIKQQAPETYAQYIYLLAREYANQAKNSSGETQTVLKTQALAILETVRHENPKLYFRNPMNVSEHMKMFESAPEKKIQLLEEFQEMNDAVFWNPESYPQPCNQLMNLYLDAAEKNPLYREKATAFATEIKTRIPRFFYQQADTYVSRLFLRGKQKDPAEASSTLEELRDRLGNQFFQKNRRVDTLAQAYEQQQQFAKAIALYEECRIVNPDMFWNIKHMAGYEKLLSLYQKNQQPEKALALCEEAKTNSATFWEASFTGGYVMLATMYEQAGNIPEAVAVYEEAERRDPRFFNPTLNEGYPQLAQFYERTNDTAKAIQILEQGRQSDTHFWDSGFTNPRVFTLFELYKKNGDADKAQQLIAELKEKMKSLKTNAALYNKYQTFLQQI